MSEARPLHGRIAKLFVEKLHVEVPSADTDLFDTGVLDSLVFVDLLFHLEHEFGITVSFDDLEVDNFRSINRIVEFLSQNGHIRQTQQRVRMDPQVPVQLPRKALWQ